MNIKQEELSFQLMVEASPTALILVNGYGKIAYLNAFAEKLFQYQRNELIEEDLHLLLPERYKAEHTNLLKHYFKNPSSRQMGENMELYALKKDGKEFPVEIGLNPIVTDEGTLILAAIIDITDRKEASEQFRLVVESAPNAMILVDDKGGIVMINKQTEVLFGYERKELLGEKMEILVPDRLKDKHPNLRKSFHAKPQTRAMGAGRDLYAMRKNGSEVPIEIGLNPISRDDGKYVLASIIDISERKKNEEVFKLYTKRLEDKNQELEQFSYIASHDLREPLNSISGLIDLIFENDKENLDEDVLRKLSFIDESSNRMKELITGLLDYARLGKNSELKKIDFNSILNDVISDLGSIIVKTNAEIEIASLPSIYAYEVEIRLLFQNLISNALKYKRENASPKIHISAKNQKHGWEFAVKDNGIGIPSNQKHKIFLLFQRLHARDEFEGIGIGLAHCKKIVELHDGSIWVESGPGEGSTFYFSLPTK